VGGPIVGTHNRDNERRLPGIPEGRAAHLSRHDTQL
jgi:hypothetical protein